MKMHFTVPSSVTIKCAPLYTAKDVNNDNDKNNENNNNNGY